MSATKILAGLTIAAVDFADLSVGFFLKLNSEDFMIPRGTKLSPEQEVERDSVVTGLELQGRIITFRSMEGSHDGRAMIWSELICPPVMNTMLCVVLIGVRIKEPTRRWWVGAVHRLGAQISDPDAYALGSCQCDGCQEEQGVMASGMRAVPGRRLHA